MAHLHLAQASSHHRLHLLPRLSTDSDDSVTFLGMVKGQTRLDTTIDLTDSESDTATITIHTTTITSSSTASSPSMASNIEEYPAVLFIPTSRTNPMAQATSPSGPSSRTMVSVPDPDPAFELTQEELCVISKIGRMIAEAEQLRRTAAAYNHDHPYAAVADQTSADATSKSQVINTAPPAIINADGDHHHHHQAPSGRARPAIIRQPRAPRRPGRTGARVPGPSPCELCGKVIKRNFTLHQRAAHGPKNFFCRWPRCSFAAAYHHLTARHLKQSHRVLDGAVRYIEHIITSSPS